jgi:capsular polysaccharide biosynthesis protein
MPIWSYQRLKRYKKLTIFGTVIALAFVINPQNQTALAIEENHNFQIMKPTYIATLQVLVPNEHYRKRLQPLLNPQKVQEILSGRREWFR